MDSARSSKKTGTRVIDMKKNQSYYFVHYVQSCSPRLKKLKTKLEVRKFIEKFLKKEGEDNWIDFVVYGTLEFASDYYEEGLSAKK